MDALRLACEYIAEDAWCPRSNIEPKWEGPLCDPMRCEGPSVDCWVSYFEAKAKEGDK